MLLLFASVNRNQILELEKKLYKYQIAINIIVTSICSLQEFL